jgi:hypothetical protein
MLLRDDEEKEENFCMIIDIFVLSRMLTGKMIVTCRVFFTSSHRISCLSKKKNIAKNFIH